jgi:phasin family protein
MARSNPRRRTGTAQPAAVGIASAAAVLAGSTRKNVEAFVGAGLTSAAGTRALLKRRLEILRDTLSEMRAVGKLMRHAGLRVSLAHLDDLARGAAELTLSSARELTCLAATTQKEALQILAQRLRDDLNEFSRLRSGAAAPRSA